MKRSLLALIVAAGWATVASAQIDWTPYSGNPVINPDFDRDSEAIYRPTVIKWDGQYHMWYGKLWVFPSKWMAYAISDDGIAWTAADNAVLGPSSRQGRFDEVEGTYGSVVLDGDTLKMWYAGRGFVESGIGYAWSVDGYTWTKVPGQAGGNSVLSPTSEGSGALVITYPAVVEHGGVFHMWYSRRIPTNSILGFETRIGYARSTDGVTWDVISGDGTDGAVLDLGADGEFDSMALLWPTVLYNNGVFEMWYQGLGFDAAFNQIVPRIGCARSSDGISWEKIPGALSQAGGCFNTLAQPSVLLEDGVYKMWYALSAADENGDVVMYATSEQANTAAEEFEIPSSETRLDVYPNPSSSGFNVRFVPSRPGTLMLEVHDLLGRTVSVTTLRPQAMGEQQAAWNGLDRQGQRVPAGAYILTILEVSSGVRSAASPVYVTK